MQLTLYIKFCEFTIISFFKPKKKILLFAATQAKVEITFYFPQNNELVWNLRIFSSKQRLRLFAIFRRIFKLPIIILFFVYSLK